MPILLTWDIVDKCQIVLNHCFVSAETELSFFVIIWLRVEHFMYFGEINLFCGIKYDFSKTEYLEVCDGNLQQELFWFYLHFLLLKHLTVAPAPATHPPTFKNFWIRYCKTVTSCGGLPTHHKHSFLLCRIYSFFLVFHMR